MRQAGGPGEGRGARRATPRPAMAAVLALAVSIASAACGTSPFELTRSEFERNRARWEALGIVDYDFSTLRNCGECPLDARRAARIEVRRGSVIRATFLDDGVEARGLVQPNVDDLFDTIERAIADRAAQLSVSYDPEFGYPTDISADISREVADDEFGILAWDLEPF